MSPPPGSGGLRMAPDGREVDHAASRRSAQGRPASGAARPRRPAAPSARHAHINRIPLAVALVQVAPWTAGAQHMQHPVQKPPIVVRGTRLPPALKRQQPADDLPLRVAQIASRQHRLLAKGSLESAHDPFGNPLCQQDLAFVFHIRPARGGHRAFADRARTQMRADERLPRPRDKSAVTSVEAGRLNAAPCDKS